MEGVDETGAGVCLRGFVFRLRPLLFVLHLYESRKKNFYRKALVFTYFGFVEVFSTCDQ